LKWSNSKLAPATCRRWNWQWKNKLNCTFSIKLN